MGEWWVADFDVGVKKMLMVGCGQIHYILPDLVAMDELGEWKERERQKTPSVILVVVDGGRWPWIRATARVGRDTGPEHMITFPALVAPENHLQP